MSVISFLRLYYTVTFLSCICMSQVQTYDIPSNAIIHKICLAHPISSIDVWRGYLLIGSSLVHLVDTRQGNKWKRMVVVDVEEKGTLQVPTSFSMAIMHIPYVPVES